MDRNQAVSSERLTNIYSSRIVRFDPKLHCVITLIGDSAIRQARQADSEIAAGRYRGPLHGIPWGAKDLLDTAGIATTYGAELYHTVLGVIVKTFATPLMKLAVVLNPTVPVSPANLAIEGMHWGACVRRVTSALQSVEGATVNSVEVGSATVAFDAAEITAQNITAALDRDGFPACVQQ